ncbi:12527_t:CDS:2 [Entrophospora sp. SA101]|nr:12527_t:CDS:2 [Entrophospora sp. SA101]
MPHSYKISSGHDWHVPKILSAWHDANSAQHGHLQNPTPDLPAYQVNISISDIFWDLQIVAGAQMLGV